MASKTFIPYRATIKYFKNAEVNISSSWNNDLSFFIPEIGIHESAGSFYFSRYVFLYSSRIASGTRLPPVAHAMCVAFFIFSSR